MELTEEEKLVEEKRIAEVTEPGSSRWIKPKLPFGEQLIEDIDPEGVLLDDEQRAKIRKIENAEALKSLIYADLGETMNPDIETAEKVFGKLLMRKFELPPLIMTWRFYTIVQCQLCIEDTKALMKDKTLTGTEKINAGRLRNEAIKCLNILLSNATALAKLVCVMKVPKEKSEPAKTPKNVAPRLSD